MEIGLLFLLTNLHYRALYNYMIDLSFKSKLIQTANKVLNLQPYKPQTKF